MKFRDYLDKFIEDAILEGFTPEFSADTLLSEDAVMLETGESLSELALTERVVRPRRRAAVRRSAVRRAARPKKPKRRAAGGGMRGQKRVFRKVAGGGRMLVRKQGRVNPTRSMRMRRSRVKRAMAAKRAARNPQTKMKRRRTMQARKRMMPRKKSLTRKSAARPKTSYRGFHGAKRHAAPRRRPVRRR